MLTKTNTHQKHTLNVNNHKSNLIKAVNNQNSEYSININYSIYQR